MAGWGRGLMMAAVGAALATGCAHGDHKGDERVVQEMTEFRLGREDRVEVSVWQQPELSRTVPVRPDGNITLPLVGDMKAEGLKPQELEAKVAEALKPFVRDPRVTVIVHDVNSSRIFVTGMVGHPGTFPVRNAMTVLQALAMAGGLAEFADRSDITVLHADGTRHSVDYDDLVSGNCKLQIGAGDTVVVR